MNLNQLKYIIEIAKTGSINHAAANLFISQSVLSTAVSRLEKEIGQTIFFRSNRGITLTPFGHTFVSYVTSIQAQLEQLDAMILHGASQDALSLSIASTGYYFLSQFCTEIYKKYKTIGVRVEQIEGHVNHIADMVASGNVGLGIVNIWTCYKNSYLKQIHAKKLQYYPIATLDVAVTVSRNNPLFFSDSDCIASEELASYPCVTYAYLDSGPYSDIYHRLKLRDSGNRIVTSSRSVIYETLLHSDAYYLNSAYPFDSAAENTAVPYAQLRTLTLSNCSVRSEVAWIKRIEHMTSPIEDELINKVIQFFSSDI